MPTPPATATTSRVPASTVPYSIVTAVRDRPSQLRRTARAISAHGTHAEHLIVDWSSQPPVQREELPADGRIRVVRVEGERQWWLSRAYNHGFRLARHGWILKADADALLGEAFFAAFEPEAATLQIRHLVGGVEAERGLEDLGLFAVERAALLAVGGFNPHLFGWGFDDLDLFERLFLSPGCRLSLLPGEGAENLPHGLAQRLGGREEQPERMRLMLTLRQAASLEANRCMARLTRTMAPDLEAGADCLHQLPPTLQLERQRALLRGWLRPLLGRHGQPLAQAVPAGWLPAVLRGLGIRELPRLPAKPSHRL